MLNFLSAFESVHVALIFGLSALFAILLIFLMIERQKEQKRRHDGIAHQEWKEQKAISEAFDKTSHERYLQQETLRRSIEHRDEDDV